MSNSNKKKDYVFGVVKIMEIEEILDSYSHELKTFEIYALIPMGPDTDNTSPPDPK